MVVIVLLTYATRAPSEPRDTRPRRNAIVAAVRSKLRLIRCSSRCYMLLMVPPALLPLLLPVRLAGRDARCGNDASLAANAAGYVYTTPAYIGVVSTMLRVVTALSARSHVVVVGALILAVAGPAETVGLSINSR